MPRKIDAGEVLAAVGGVLVLVALFLNWFDDFSGWEAFEALDLVIAVLAGLAVAAVVSSVVDSSSPLSPRILPWLGAVLLAIVVVQLVEPPPAFAGGEPAREVGGWLALAGSALVLLGGALRLAHISVTVAVGGRDVRKRVPAVDRRPAGPGAPAASEPVAPERSEAPTVDDQHTKPFSPVEKP